MTRRIITLAASALALTFGVAPLTVQALGSPTSLSATVPSVATVSGPSTLNIDSALAPELGSAGNELDLTVDTNMSYKLTFSGSYGTDSTGFGMAQTSGTGTITYTVTGKNGEDDVYTSGTAGNDLAASVSAPKFTIAIPSVLTNKLTPAGSYSGSLAYTITADTP
jgi:hypothetical protein